MQRKFLSEAGHNVTGQAALGIHFSTSQLAGGLGTGTDLNGYGVGFRARLLGVNELLQLGEIGGRDVGDGAEGESVLLPGEPAKPDFSAEQPAALGFTPPRTSNGRTHVTLESKPR